MKTLRCFAKIKTVDRSLEKTATIGHMLHAIDHENIFIFNVLRTDVEYLINPYHLMEYEWFVIDNDSLKVETWKRTKPNGNFNLVNSENTEVDFLYKKLFQEVQRMIPKEFSEEEERLFNESLDEKFTGKHRWICRCKLYKNPNES